MAFSFPDISSFFKIFGLPCIIGVAAIDPGNLEVDLQAGAALGYSLIWSILLASILGCILQSLSAHLAIYTGLHLAEVCSLIYKRNPLISRTVFSINLFSVIAFDIAEVIGTAFATRMLFGIPLWLGMIISVCDTMLVLYLQKKGLNRIEIIVEGLLFILAGCLIYEFILSKPDFGLIAAGTFIPTFGSDQSRGIILAISIMGSVIMSHNLFLHSWLEKERRKSPIPQTSAPALDNNSTTTNVTDAADTPLDEEQPEQTQDSVPQLQTIDLSESVGSGTGQLFKDCRYALIESSAIFFSTFLINMCVLVVAATLPRDAVEQIDNFGLKDAGALLQHVIGQRFASVAWGVALLASGHAATVTGVLASQAICEGFLNIHDTSSSSGVVLGSRLVAIIPALIAALLAGENGSDSLAVASQAVLSFSLPFAAVPLFKALYAIGRVRQLYSRSLLFAGFGVFAIVMVANGFAIREFVAIVYQFGWLPTALLALLTTGMLAVLFILMASDVDIADLELDSGSPHELSRLLASK